MRAAILDFGTNTFNLLIAEKLDGSFKVLYDGKQGVKLGKGGIHKGIISEEAMERGFNAIANHMETIRKYGAEEIHAYATSAMRNARNGKEFARVIEKKFGFKTNIIGGEEEAALIYEGIRQSVDFGEENVMILDIGGGSNEFILCNKDGILWKHSFEIGMARIIERFSLSDPISADEVKQLETYYEESLGLLDEAVGTYKPTMLVGASGTFDTLAAMSVLRFGDEPVNRQTFQPDAARTDTTETTDSLTSQTLKSDSTETSLPISEEHFRKLFHLLLGSTTEERLAMPGMEPVRVEMIVPASIFINFVYNRYHLKSMYQSRYALKEGVMSRIVAST